MCVFRGHPRQFGPFQILCLCYVVSGLGLLDDPSCVWGGIPWLAPSTRPQRFGDSIEVSAPNLRVKIKHRHHHHLHRPPRHLFDVPRPLSVPSRCPLLHFRSSVIPRQFVVSRSTVANSFASEFLRRSAASATLAGIMLCADAAVFQPVSLSNKKPSSYSGRPILDLSRAGAGGASRWAAARAISQSSRWSVAREEWVQEEESQDEAWRGGDDAHGSRRNSARSKTG